MVVGFQRLRVMGELGTKSTQSYVCHFLLKFAYLQYQNERRAKKNSLRGRQREEEKGNVVVALTTNQERRPAPLLFPFASFTPNILSFVHPLLSLVPSQF